MLSKSFRRAAAALTLASVLLLSAPAAAAPVTLFTTSDFFIPRPASATDQDGVRRELIEFDLEANGFGDLIGQECEFVISADNGDSVHVNNYGVLSTNGGVETDIAGTESQPNVTTTVLELSRILVGNTIWLYNVMEPDPDGIVGTSVEYTVTADCALSATTTTMVTTTTTEAPTTTTVPPTTSTTIATTTSSSVLGETNTTAVAGDSTSTTSPAVSGSTLPFTGSPVDTAGAALAATALMMLGAGMLLAARTE